MWDALTADLLLNLRVPCDAIKALPPAPTPDVAAALSAGYLAAVERLLRRLDLTDWPPGPVPGITGLGPGAYEQTAAGWAQLLAYGPRAAVFSLLATVAKRVRRALADQDASDGLLHDAGWAVRWVAVAVPQRWLLRLAEAAPDAHAKAAPPDLNAAAAGASGAAAAAAVLNGLGAESAAAAGVGGYPQLRLALTFIATRIMPALLQLLPRIAVFSPTTCGTVLPELLDWLPLLATVARDRPDWGEQLSFTRVAPPLLGAAVALMNLSPDPDLQSALEACVHKALRATLQVAPEELLAEALARADEAAGEIAEESAPPAATEVGSGRSAAGRRSVSGRTTLPQLLRLLGLGGMMPEPEMPAPLEGAAVAVEASTEGAATGQGRGSDGGCRSQEAGRGARPPPADVRSLLSAAALLAAPAELEAALPPACGNPGCMNLAADSEADLPLTVPCGGGGGGCRRAYCSGRCREQHVLAGHAWECASQLLAGLSVLAFWGGVMQRVMRHAR